MNSELIRSMGNSMMYIEENGGINFDQILNIRKYAQQLLDLNSWGTCEEENIVYSNAVNRLVQNRESTYGID